MPNFSFVLLYVESPPESAKFYAGLLGARRRSVADLCHVAASRRGHARPVVAQRRGAKADRDGRRRRGAFTVADPAAVSDTHADWSKRGLSIAQVPTKMDFGTTFVALDPDGHRLRVFAPAAS